MRRFAVSLAAVLALAAACSGSTEPSPTLDLAALPRPASPPPTQGASRGMIGEPVELSSLATITVLSATDWSTAVQVPQAGFRFIDVELTVTALDAELPLGDDTFAVIDATRKEYAPTLGAVPALTLPATLADGETAAGHLTFQVPLGSSYELCFQPRAGSQAAISLTTVAAMATPMPAATQIYVEPMPTARATAKPAASGCPAKAAKRIVIKGSKDFLCHTRNALALLKSKAKTQYARVLSQVVTIKQVTAGSGIDLAKGTFRVGRETAYAPGWSRDGQVVWYASAIVHDACHRARFRRGLSSGGRTGELACLRQQRDALALIDTSTSLRSYVQGLIDCVDDPQCQYWKDPNRHW